MTGLLLGGFGLASLAFAATVVLAVLVHEPIAILTGRRGVRLETMLRGRARRRALVLGAIGLATGVAALASSPTAALQSIAVPAGFVVLLLPAWVMGREKTLWVELIVVAALAASLLPIAMAGGVGWSSALAASAVWFLSFSLGTVTVHAVKARHKKTRGTAWIPGAAPLLAAGAIVAGVVVARANLVGPGLVMAIVPPVVITLAISVVRVHPRNLRRVGWSLVGANVVTLAVLLSVV